VSRAGRISAGYLALLKRYCGCGAPLFDIVTREEEHLPSLREAGLKQPKDKDLHAPVRE